MILCAKAFLRVKEGGDHRLTAKTRARHGLVRDVGICFEARLSAIAEFENRISGFLQRKGLIALVVEVRDIIKQVVGDVPGIGCDAVQILRHLVDSKILIHDRPRALYFLDGLAVVRDRDLINELQSSRVNPPRSVFAYDFPSIYIRPVIGLEDDGHGVARRHDLHLAAAGFLLVQSPLRRR